MKNKTSIFLTSIKTNNKIVKILAKNKKINLPFATLWVSKQPDQSQIYYALLVNKSQFKTAVSRNKIKRQIRNIFVNSKFKGGINILIKPNSTYLKKQYVYINEQINKIINKYQNGK